jgi:hypothetical protein
MGVSKARGRHGCCSRKVSPCVEDIGHLHGRRAHDCDGFRSRRERGTIGGGVTRRCSSGMGCMEVPSRQVQIRGRVRQVGVAQQQLNRSKIGARFQKMCGVRVPERVRSDALIDPRLPCDKAHGVPDHLVVRRPPRQRLRSSRPGFPEERQEVVGDEALRTPTRSQRRNESD